MIKKIIKIIHYLRVYFLAFITVAFLYFVGLQPIEVGKFVGAKLSRAVGMSVSIPANPFNRLALQLEEKEDKLNKKELELNQIEEKLKNTPPSSSNNFWLYFLAGGIIVLFILILINYYFDYKRRKKEYRPTNKFKV
jgi:hypothetical protein